MRPIRCLAVAALACALTGIAFAAQPPKSARELGVGTPPNLQIHPVVPLAGTLIWDNGNFDGVNGLSSERDTFTSGNGGPAGLDVSDCADDFQITSSQQILTVDSCFVVAGSVTTAHMYIFADNGGVPGTEVAGAPVTADLQTTTFTDNTTLCPPNIFGLTSRQFEFDFAPGQVVLAPGTYWVAVVGDGQGDTNTRAFWATSTPGTPLSNAVWGSPVFGITYWTDVGPSISGEEAFSFQVYGQPNQPSNIPTLGKTGILVLSLLLAAAAVVAIARRR